MRSRKQSRIIFALLALVSLFVVFFVGREFNHETWKRNFIITSDGVTHFRQWLDVRGWTKLVYKINYDKYEQLYSDPQELQAIKKMIETIILQNIDKRISKLGVSDYRAYVQNLNEEPYVVVEIGGIADLDQAKEIIGKTIELEFRLPNEEEPTPQIYAERKEFAQTLLTDVSQNANMMQQLTDARQSENVFYHRFDNIRYEQLPKIFQDNIYTINTVKTGQIYPNLLEWTYASIQDKDELGATITTDLNGFAFFRVLDVKTQAREKVLGQDLVAFADMYKLPHKEEPFKWEIGINVGEYQYDENNQKLTFNVKTLSDGLVAYNAEVFFLPTPNTIGMETEEATLIQKEFDANLSNAKAIIKQNWDTSSIPDLQSLSQGRLDQESLSQNIPQIANSELNIGDVESFAQEGNTLIIKIIDTKTSEEKLSHLLIIEDLTAAQRAKFQEDLKTETLYTIEDVFIQDRETRLPAIDQKTNKILNGAYFKYANKDTSQLWEPVVAISFDDQGKELFCSITEQNVGTQMAIFVGGQLLTSPVIRDKICGGTAQIDGWFTNESAQDLVDGLNEWTLPAPLILMQEEKLSPTLWENALLGALIAGLVGILVITWLIRFMYGFKEAIVTLWVLLMFVAVLAAVMKLIDYALSLSGIAAIVLSIGMWVDANILIFERIREELKSGKTMSSAIQTGYERSRAPIRDGNVSTGLIAFLLFTLGISMFKWFGSMMILNIILILFLNVPLTKELLKTIFHRKADFLKESKLDKKLKN